MTAFGWPTICWHDSTAKAVFKSGFARIDAEIVTAEEGEQLKQALLKALERCADLATQGSILWALIRTQEPDLKPLYVSYLKDALRAMEGSSCIISSCLDGLNDLGEDVYDWDKDDSMVQGATEVGKNWHQTRSYLARINGPLAFPFR